MDGCSPKRSQKSSGVFCKEHDEFKALWALAFPSQGELDTEWMAHIQMLLVKDSGLPPLLFMPRNS